MYHFHICLEVSELKCNPKYIMSSKDIKVVIGGVLKRNRYDFSQLGCLICLLDVVYMMQDIFGSSLRWIDIDSVRNAPALVILFH